MRGKLIVLMTILCANLLSAQADGPDFFRSIGKIYVVVAVMVVTFIGIVLFLIYIERKIKKLENEISSHE